MRNLFLNAVILIATTALSTWANAQNAYRCGNTYSQTPCPNAVPVDVNDSRTSAQKKQTDAATAGSTKAGDAMEKSRLAQEKRDLAANRGPTVLIAPATVQPTAPATPGKAHAKRKKNTSQYFTAQAPREKKEKKPAKAKKESASKS